MSKLTEIKEAINALKNSDSKSPWKWSVKTRTKGNGEWFDKEFSVGDLISPINEKSSNSILDVQQNKYGQPEIYCWDETAADLIKKAPEYISYLLSLLEENYKALAFYEDDDNHKWSHTYDETGEVEEIPSKVAKDRGRIARKALNTSSNNEGEK